VQINVNHTHHLAPDATAYVKSMLTAIYNQGAKIMATLADIKAEIATLTADVTAETTAEQSAITLLGGLSAQITNLSAQLATALANDDPAGLQAASDALTALGTNVTTNTAALAQAVTANTPPAPPAP
jgi:hypothetical protein